MVRGENIPILRQRVGLQTPQIHRPLPSTWLCTSTDARLRKWETHSPTYIYWSNNLHYTFLVGKLLRTPTDSELQRQETSSYTYIYFCNSIHCRFLVGRLLSTPTNSELQRQETPSHTHIYYCNNGHYRFLAGRLLSTPTDYELQRRKHTANPTNTAEAASAVHFLQGDY